MYCIFNQHRPDLLPCNHIGIGQCIPCADYQAGKTKPAYSMPAIPVRVEYSTWYKCTFAMRGVWAVACYCEDSWFIV